MAKAILFIFVGLFSVTKLADAICCESIKSEVEKNVEANKTLCASGSALSPKCCKDIANEVGKYLAAYETLCLKGKKRKVFSYIIYVACSSYEAKLKLCPCVLDKIETVVYQVFS